MKILLTADPEIPVPPHQYGGIERIIDGLAYEYNQQGHEVILLAHPDSTCQWAKKVIAWKGASASNKKDIILNAIQLYRVYTEYKPAVIHSFSRLLYLYPVLLFSNCRIVQCYQRAINVRSTQMGLLLGGKRLQLVACAKHMFQHLPQANQWKAIYNFANTKHLTLPLSDKPRQYLAFLGRIEDIKGTKEAILVAVQSGEQLVIAGNIPKEHQNYFDMEVAPRIDQQQIRYIGPVNDVQKKELLQGAKALLFPIKWAEPFGIVMAESFACGTPVIAFNVGSVPEVIQDGRNGFICKDIKEMVSRIKAIESIKPQVVRANCVEQFSSSVIAKQYLELFNQLLFH